MLPKVSSMKSVDIYFKPSQAIKCFFNIQLFTQAIKTKQNKKNEKPKITPKPQINNRLTNKISYFLHLSLLKCISKNITPELKSTFLKLEFC